MQTFQRMHMVNASASEMPKGELMMMKLITANSETESGAMISKLATLMEISNPAVSQKINVLEEKGYVERYSTKNDRRVVYVKLTEAGKKILERENERLMNSMKIIFDKMGEEDTEKFIELMSKLYKIIQETKEEQNKSTK